MITPLKDIVKLRWEAFGFSCNLWIDPPKKSWENFVHPTEELVYCIEGAIELEWDSKKKLLLPGQELLIPAKTLHSHRNISDKKSIWLYGYRLKKL